MTSQHIFYSYGDNVEMILLIDGDRVRLDGKALGYLMAGWRAAVIYIRPNILEYIAKAKVVEGQFGSLQFKLRPEDQEKIAAFVRYFAPSSSSAE